MKRYYDIRQVIRPDLAIRFLARKLNISEKDILNRFELATLEDNASFINFCTVKGYSPIVIIVRKLNDLAIEEHLNVRFTSPIYQEAFHV